jgi:hypothetical protein
MFLVVAPLTAYAQPITEDELAEKAQFFQSKSNSRALPELMNAEISCDNSEACRHPADVIIQAIDDSIRTLNKEDQEKNIPLFNELLEVEIPIEQKLSLLKLASEHFPEEFASLFRSRDLRKAIWNQNLTRSFALRLYSVKEFLPKSYTALLKEVEFRYAQDIKTMASHRKILFW